MEKSHVVVSLLLVLLFHVGIATAVITEDGSEAWGYVPVRPSTLNLFYNLYPNLDI